MKVVEAGPGRPDGHAWGDTVVRSRTVEFEYSRPELRRVHQEEFCDRLGIVGQSECGVNAVPVGHGVQVRANGEGDCRVFGLQTCGSSWACAVCSARRTRREARELEEAIDRCHDRGGAVYLVTATIPHHAGHRCKDVLDAVSSSWSYVLGGSPWRRWADRIEYLGSVRGLDVTHSWKNGWHWHVHALVFSDEPVPADRRKAWRDWMSERWARKVAAWYRTEDGELACRPLNRAIPDDHEPYFGTPNPEHGLQIQRGQNAAEYLASIGLARELTRMECKKGRDRHHRTPWQILHDYADRRELQDARLWMEYVEATKGRALLYWSPRLRETLELGEQLELELDDEYDRTVARITEFAWRLAACRCPAIEARVTEAAERGGTRAVEEVVRRILEPDGWRVDCDPRDGTIIAMKARVERRAA